MSRKTAKNVTTIPATLSRFTATPINDKRKRRTAAYARVSTDSDEQVTSYDVDRHNLRSNKRRNKISAIAS